MSAFANGFRPSGESQGILSEQQIKEEIEKDVVESRAFWSSSKLSGKLMVELPFWLMVDECSIDLDIEGCRAQAKIIQNLVAVHDGPYCLQSGCNVAALLHEGEEPHCEEKEILDELRAPVFRPMKSVVSFGVDVHAVALESWKGRRGVKSNDCSGIRAVNRASQYFATLAYAHLPFINALIEAYRSTSFDPFAFSVSEFDLPNCFVQGHGILCHTCLFPYSAQDDRPSLRDLGSDKGKPFVAVETGLLQTQAASPIPAGKSQLLDAKSLMYRGRYGEAIRSAVTAIEVAVEVGFRDSASACGQSQELTDRILEETKNNFFERLAKLEEILGRRVPGPHVFFGWLEGGVTAPYLNGVRLKEELGWVRQLRHDIVHRGVAVSIFDRGLALRAIETMSWLFDWITQDDDSVSESTENYGYFASLRGQFQLQPAFTKDGIKVEEPKPIQHDEQITYPKDIMLRQYQAVSTGGDLDIDLSISMSLAALNVPFSDSVPSEKTGFEHERFAAKVGETHLLVFCIKGQQVSENGIEEVMERRGEVDVEFDIQTHALVVLPPGNHEEAPGLDDRVTVVDVETLSSLVLGMDRWGWLPESIVQLLKMPGDSHGIPTCYREVGVIKTCYPKQHVVSITLAHGETFESGATLGVRSDGEFVEFLADSIQHNRKMVSVASGHRDFGVKLTDGLGPFKANTRVFLRETIREEEKLEMPGAHDGTAEP